MWRQVYFSQGRTFSPFAYRVFLKLHLSSTSNTAADNTMLLTAHANLICTGPGIRGYLAYKGMPIQLQDGLVTLSVKPHL